MSYIDDVVRSEQERIMCDLYEDCRAQCPECGSCSWDYLVKNVCGDVVGCEECVSKLYADELTEMHLDAGW